MEQNNNVQETEVTQDAPVTPTKFDRAKFLSTKLKTGVKRLVGQDHSDADTDDDGEVSDLFQDAAFNPQQVAEASPHESGTLRDKLHREAHGLAVMIKNPRRAMRNKYTRRVAENLSVQPATHDQECDEDLVDAYDALDRADALTEDESDTDIGISTTRDFGQKDPRDLRGFEKEVDQTDPTSNQVEDAKARIRQVEARRDSLRAAWTLGRQVKRVRVPRPMSLKPKRQDYLQRTKYVQNQEVQWDRYLAALALWHTRQFTSHYIDDFDELPFDLREMSSAIERLAVVSAPWQSFLLQVRNVYLWQDPRRTLKFAALYWILWYFQHIVTAGFVWLIVATVKNRLQPTRVQGIRERMQRARGQQAKAQAWGELIQRHGKHDWIEPFLDDIGPMLQLELNDMSNLLEMFQSFYRWEQPRKTLTTLFFFTTCLLLTALTDAQTCARLVWMGLGFMFFVSLPVSAKYPKYRRLIQPIYWIFWDIPNGAELVLIQLQEKAILRDFARVEKAKRSNAGMENPRSHSSDSDFVSADEMQKTSRYKNDDVLQQVWNTDHVTFRAVHSEAQIHGRLKLLRHGLWYYDKKVKIYHPYSNLLEMRKVDISKASDPDASKTARFARRIQETTSLQFLPSGIEFVFLRSTPYLHESVDTPQAQMCRGTKDEERLSLTVSESDRDKIFSLVIGWSNLKWQPQFTLNQRSRLSSDSDNPSKRGKGNEDLDNTVKSFVH